jgi:predicted Fe-Mo cluster-binding NifX family protein
MRVALPLFGKEVAPRFCFAREMIVVDLVDGREDGRRYVMLGPEHGPTRIKLLRAHGIEILLCSGFNRHLLPVATESGIEVVWGLQGEVDEILEKFRTGRLETGGPTGVQTGRKARRTRRRSGA